MCLHRIDKIRDYLAYLKETPAELKLLAGDLLVSVTDFFRDPHAWEVLAQQVIPDIVEMKSAIEAARVWVAGCATGEEAYTIAMLMLEEISKQKKTIPLQVFASDIDNGALDEARAGQYTASIVADLTPERLQRFFSLQDGDLHFQVKKSLREPIVFAEQDLLADPPFSQLDLILCRNVMIYLKPHVQHKLINLFRLVLRQGGYLMLGTAETIGRQEAFALIVFNALEKPPLTSNRQPMRQEAISLHSQPTFTVSLSQMKSRKRRSTRVRSFVNWKKNFRRPKTTFKSRLSSLKRLTKSSKPVMKR